MNRLPSYITSYGALVNDEQRILDWANGALYSKNDLKKNVISFHRIFSATKDSSLRNSIALLLAEIHDPSSVEILFEFIKNNILSSDIGTVIHAASYFDCAPYLLYLVKIIILRHDSTTVDAYNAISEIHDSVDYIVIDEALSMLQREMDVISSNADKYLDLKETQVLISNLSKK